MKITFISDTHGKHQQLDLDGGDILIHAGDVEARNEWDLRNFLEWFEAQDYEYKVFVAGNHDFYLQRPDARQIIDLYQVEYLQDEDISINGVKIWGSPWSLPFMRWAFMQSDEKLDKVYSDIPEDVDILVNHGAPKNIRDSALPNKSTGSKALAYHANRVSPKYCVFGHIHESAGQCVVGETMYINASVLDEKYNMTNEPTIITYEQS